MTGYEKYWRAVATVTAVAFAAGEGHAFYRRNSDGTLTHWGNTRINRSTWTRAAWWLAAGWVTYHMDTGRLGVPWRWNDKELPVPLGTPAELVTDGYPADSGDALPPS